MTTDTSQMSSTRLMQRVQVVLIVHEALDQGVDHHEDQADGDEDCQPRGHEEDDEERDLDAGQHAEHEAVAGVVLLLTKGEKKYALRYFSGCDLVVGKVKKIDG